MTDWKIQLVIDKYDNKKRKIESGIPQDSPISPIFFLIYISWAFMKVSKINCLVMSLLFIDDLSFIALCSLIKKIVKALKKVAYKIIEWGRLNAVIYNISKTEAVLFSKFYWQPLNK